MRKHKNGSVISEKDDYFVFLKEGLFIVFMCVCVHAHTHICDTHCGGHRTPCGCHFSPLNT